jgi:hypothetical protein
MLRLQFAVAPLVALAVASTALDAQSAIPKQQVLSIQPISSIVGFYSGEYERVVSQSVTLGVGASYLDNFFGENSGDDPHYLSTEAKLRFYPAAQPLRGFSFGVTAGFTRVSSHETVCDFGCNTTRSTASGPSAGFQLDYSWLLGTKENFAVALGAGGKRLFISDQDTNATLAYPTARISVGMAF